MNESLNTTLGNIAATVEEIYNNGRTVSSDEKLSYDDFLQLCFTQYGDIASIQYYNEMRRGNEGFYFAQSIQTITAEVEKECNVCPSYFILADYALLPYMSGILAIYPETKESMRDPDDDFLKMPTGGESLYGKPKVLDDLGLKFYIVTGDKVELYGDEPKKVNVKYIPVEEDFIVPSQIGKVIINEILKIVLPGRAATVDTHEDTDPNQQTFKQRLDQPQDIT